MAPPKISWMCHNVKTKIICFLSTQVLVWRHLCRAYVTESRKVRLVPKFKEYDRDGNGYISLEEASMILQNKPFNFPADKVVVLLRKFDKDGNGKLDIDEFADFYAEAKATSVLSQSINSRRVVWLMRNRRRADVCVLGDENDWAKKLVFKLLKILSNQRWHTVQVCRNAKGEILWTIK